MNQPGFHAYRDMIQDVEFIAEETYRILIDQEVFQRYDAARERSRIQEERINEMKKKAGVEEEIFLFVPAAPSHRISYRDFPKLRYQETGGSWSKPSKDLLYAFDRSGLQQSEKAFL